VKRSDNQPSKTDRPKGGVYQLLGGPVKSNLELAKTASPVTYVSDDDPPALILHGTADKVVYPVQSKHLVAAYDEKNLSATLILEPKAGHGWKPGDEEKSKILAFLKSIFTSA